VLLSLVEAIVRDKTQRSTTAHSISPSTDEKAQTGSKPHEHHSSGDEKDGSGTDSAEELPETKRSLIKKLRIQVCDFHWFFWKYGAFAFSRTHIAPLVVPSWFDCKNSHIAPIVWTSADLIPCRFITLISARYSPELVPACSFPLQCELTSRDLAALPVTISTLAPESMTVTAVT
jgi:hypothetical protein